jgi:hypothetical protein
MRDFAAYRASTIRYWEKRRIIYNLALILPALFGYSTATELAATVGDRSYLGLLSLGALFLISAIAANISYSLCYTLEFLFGTDQPGAAWLRSRRRLILIAGTLFAMFLAVVGGRNIGMLEYQFH